MSKEPPKRRPEDIYDEIGTPWIRFFAKHAWPVAEFSFKLTGWLFVAAAVIALGIKSGSVAIMIAGGLLTAIWFVAAMATIFKAIGYVHDAARDRWLSGYDPHTWKGLLIHMVIMVIAVTPLVHLFAITLVLAGEIVGRLVGIDGG